MLSLTFDADGIEKAYVTDSLKITLRTGPSFENRIIRMLSSGQSLEVLDAYGDWSQVRVVRDGERKQEGWVLSRYLITRVPWEVRVNPLIEENIRLKKRLDHIERKLNETVHQKQDPASNIRDSTEILQKLEIELESLKRDAEGYLGLKEKHEKTLSRLLTYKNKLKEITEVNRRLKSSQVNKWFATGALVLLCGLMIGLILGRQQRKRKSSLYY